VPCAFVAQVRISQPSSQPLLQPIQLARDPYVLGRMVEDGPGSGSHPRGMVDDRWQSTAGRVLRGVEVPLASE